MRNNLVFWAALDPLVHKLDVWMKNIQFKQNGENLTYVDLW